MNSYSSMIQQAEECDIMLQRGKIAIDQIDVLLRHASTACEKLDKIVDLSISNTKPTNASDM